jgi:hypothetical protein
VATEDKCNLSCWLNFNRGSDEARNRLCSLMIEQENMALTLRIAAKEGLIRERDQHVDEVRCASRSTSNILSFWSSVRR